jgi:hypothetical protein
MSSNSKPAVVIGYRITKNKGDPTKMNKSELIERCSRAVRVRTIAYADYVEMLKQDRILK